MINFDDATKQKRHKPNWPQISNYPNRILMIVG